VRFLRTGPDLAHVTWHAMQLLSRTAPILVLLALPAVGCTVTPGIWPFRDNERTNYPTPAMRTDAIREFAARSNGLDSPEQQEITAQLARQIQIEPDPLVRGAIIDTLTAFNTPLASQVMVAGLQDTDPIVRRKCCHGLGERGDTAAIEPLAQALRVDDAMDVRVAATKALGRIRSPDALKALTTALEDRDPALQFAAVQSVKELSGQDFGGDVRTYLQYAQSESPTIAQPTTSVAERIRSMTPF
jgi:HEAT repeat protein